MGRRSPLQNRVTPFSEIVAVPERGTLMGNRGGQFHTAGRRLTGRRWVSRRWIACVLEFRGRRRTVMSPGRYTELFFLDEPTALAAGHRPCRECRHADFERFKAAWLRGNPSAGFSPDVSIGAIDRVLHAERVGAGAGGGKATFRAPLGGLPDGTFVVLDAEPNTAYLLARGSLWRWTPGGYAGARPVGAGDAAVLTPRSTVHAMAAGYVPAWLASLGGASSMYA
jgi:hypothetical protein